MPRSLTVLSALRQRVLTTLLPAVVGGAAGYAYAMTTLAESQIRGSNMVGLYGAVGAAAGILGVRLATLMTMVLGDFLRRGD